MIYLTVPQTLYISSVVAMSLLLLLLSVLFIYKNVYAKRHYKEAIFLKLSRMSKYNDYLLLNNFLVDFDDTHVGCIDHILISKKYIFVINDFPLSGVISGDARGEHLRLINDKKSAMLIANPINYNINLIKKLNSKSRLDHTFIKGLVVVNNDSRINLGNMGDQFLMVRRKELKRTIYRFDKDNVKNLKENEVVNFINKLNIENRKRRNHE